MGIEPTTIEALIIVPMFTGFSTTVNRSDI